MNEEATEQPIAIRDKSQLGVKLTDAVVTELVIQHQRIESDVVFSNVCFQGPVDFEGCMFHGALSFEGCTFEEFVMFRGAKLPDRANFRSCKFSKGCSFAAGQSRAVTPSVENDDLHHLHFRGSTFSGYITFNNRNMQRSLDFSDCVFQDPPHFHNTKFHPGTSFARAHFFRPRRKQEQERVTRATAAYRRLKTIMTETGNIDRHSEFLAHELRTRRLLKQTSLIEKAFITLYEIGSDFGRSLLRPITFFMAISAINVLVLVLSGYHLSLAIGFVLEHTSSPYAAWQLDYFNSTPGPIRLGMIRIVAGLQSTFTLISISLLLFSIRRRLS